MFAKYVPIAVPVATQVMADLQLLLTGTTDVNALSSSCNKASSSISGLPGAWTLVDDAIGVANGGFIISGVDADGVTTKLYQIKAINATPSIQANVLSAWNSTTNTATNLTGSISLVGNVAMYVGSKGQDWFFACSATSTNGFYGIEVLRESPQLQYNTALGAWPEVALIQSSASTSAFPPTLRTPTTVSTIVAASPLTKIYPYQSAISSVTPTRFDHYGSSYIPVMPMFVGYNNGIYGRIRGGIKNTSAGLSYSFGDTMLISGQQHYMVGTSATALTLFPLE